MGALGAAAAPPFFPQRLQRLWFICLYQVEFKKVIYSVAAGFSLGRHRPEKPCH